MVHGAIISFTPRSFGQAKMAFANLYLHDVSVLSVITTPALQRFFIRREELFQETVSNGFKVLLHGNGMKDILEEVLKLKMRSDDIIVATFPKAGNARTYKNF